VLHGGLQAWQQAGYPTTAATLDPPPTTTDVNPTSSSPTLRASAGLPGGTLALSHPHIFLPGLVGDYVAQQRLPMRKELTVLFVDMADSTATILHQPPEVALAHVQCFMEVVTEVALARCGDVKDYEGDGALLYFESVSEATQAALEIRDALSRQPTNGHAPLHARFSLNVGSVIIGIIGSALRRSVALIGPSINLASRLLKQIPPSDIIATEAVVERLRKEAPVLAQRFQLWDARLELKGFHNELVTAYHVS
jgi:class 3 adenylate cyclase